MGQTHCIELRARRGEAWPRRGLRDTSSNSHALFMPIYFFILYDNARKLNENFIGFSLSFICAVFERLTLRTLEANLKEQYFYCGAKITEIVQLQNYVKTV